MPAYFIGGVRVEYKWSIARGTPLTKALLISTLFSKSGVVEYKIDFSFVKHKKHERSIKFGRPYDSI